MNIPIFLMMQQTAHQQHSTDSKPKNFDKMCEKTETSKTNFCLQCIRYYQYCVGSPHGICRGYKPDVE